jgi:hypothetical protein
MGSIRTCTRAGTQKFLTPVAPEYVSSLPERVETISGFVQITARSKALQNMAGPRGFATLFWPISLPIRPRSPMSTCRSVALLLSVAVVICSVLANVSNCVLERGSRTAGLGASAIATIGDRPGASSRGVAPGVDAPRAIAVTSGSAPTKAASRPSSGSSELPYGFELVGAEKTSAAFVPGISFGPGDASCSGPSANVTTREPVVLAASSELLCLNGARSGLVSSVWSSNLSNFTTYRNGSTTVVGCPPIPPFTNGGGCAFYASDEYTEYVPIWVHAAPVNSSHYWEPSLTGLSPSDSVFYVALEANNSTPTNTLYSLTVKVAGPMPSPVTFYVRTPSQTWSGDRNLTLLLDLDLAWTSMLNNSSSPMVYPTIGGYSVSMNYASPCSDCYVNFVESGIGQRSAWSVTMNGSAGSSTRSAPGSSVAFREPNGTYSFTAVTAADCFGDPSTGTVTIDGSDQSVAINFTLLSCAVTFAETGLPSGTNWSVVVGGVPYYSTSISIAVREPNGTYAFVVTNISGYTVSPSKGSVVVKGAGVTEPLTFSSTSKAATFLGLPIAEGYALVGATVVVVLGAGMAVGRLAGKRSRRAPGPTGAPPRPRIRPPGATERSGPS